MAKIWPKSTIVLAQKPKIQSTNLQQFGHKKCNLQAFQAKYTSINRLLPKRIGIIQKVNFVKFLRNGNIFLYCNLISV